MFKLTAQAGSGKISGSVSLEGPRGARQEEAHLAVCRAGPSHRPGVTPGVAAGTWPGGGPGLCPGLGGPV